jgi:hypothetical protein
MTASESPQHLAVLQALIKDEIHPQFSDAELGVIQLGTSQWRRRLQDRAQKLAPLLSRWPVSFDDCAAGPCPHSPPGGIRRFTYTQAIDTNRTHSEFDAVLAPSN